MRGNRAATGNHGAQATGRRQGIGDLANQFHYYRITRDNRILFGGYDALYHFGGQVREEYEHSHASFQKLASHFFTTFPQLTGLTFTHQWGGAIDTSTRFCAFFGHAHGGRVAYAAGFTGLGVGASRFAGLLGTLHTLPWADRLETLTSALTDWQGQEPQLDDICVIGFTAMPDPRKPAGDLACSSSTTPA